MICKSIATGTALAVSAAVAGGLGSDDGNREETADQRPSLAVVKAEIRLLSFGVSSSSPICEARLPGPIGMTVEPSSSKGSL
jgi:hypothetical protein